MLNSTIWGSKRVFVISRLVSVCVGMLKLFVLIRILPVEEFAAIGIVESFRTIFTALFAFGVSVGVSREAMIEKNENKRGAMVLAAYFSDVALWLTSMGLMLLVVMILSGNYLQYIDYFLLVALTGLFDRLWSTSLVVFRINERIKEFIIYGVLYSIANFAIVIYSVAYFDGVFGYFIGNATTLILFSVCGVIISNKGMSFPDICTLKHELKVVYCQLWEVSWFTYVGKSSNQLWRRLPLVVAANFLNDTVIGIVTITMELVFKIQIFNAALRPLIIPRLSAALADVANDANAYLTAAIREAKHLASINLFVISGATIGWYFLGHLFLGEERYTQIGIFFYIAILTELSAVIIDACNMCFIIPSKRLQGILVPIVSLRLLVVPAFYILLAADIGDGLSILLASLFTGAFASIFYLVKTGQVVKSLGNLQ